MTDGGTQWGGRGRLFHDLRTGQAGALVRGGLSVISATMILSLAMVVLGIIEAGGNWLRDEHIAMIIGAAAAVWCGVLVVIWWSYRRFQVVLKATFVILAIWAVLIPLMVVVEAAMQRGEEFMIASMILLGSSLSIAAVVFLSYRRHVDSAAARAIVRVRVSCPECGYSLVGLTSCRCPECGTAYTVEQLMVAMGHGQLAIDAAPEEPAEIDDEVEPQEPLALPEPG